MPHTSSRIHDHVAEINDRPQFHGSVKLDDIHCLVFSVKEVLSGNIGIFRGHTDHFVVLQKLPCFFRSAYAHPAFAESKIEDFIDPSVLFQDDVGADNADIRRAVFHIGRNVRTLCQEKSEFLLFIRKDQLS